MDVPSLPRTEPRGGARTSSRSFIHSPSRSHPRHHHVLSYSLAIVQSRGGGRLIPLDPSYIRACPIRSADRIQDLVSWKSRWWTSYREQARKRGKGREACSTHVCTRARYYDRIKPSAISFDSISRVRRIYIEGENCVSNSCRLPPYTHLPIPTYPTGS